MFIGNEESRIKILVAIIGAAAIIVAAIITVWPHIMDHYTSQQNEGYVVLSSLKIKDEGPGLSLVDVIIRNKDSIDSVIYTAEFVVLEVEPVPLRAHPYYLPSTYQYHAIMTPDDKNVSVDLSQVVPAEGVDRFQIILTLGIEKPLNCPWGSASIGWIMDPKTGTKLTHLNTKMILRFTYDENQVIESPPFNFIVRAPGYGFKATKVGGFALEDKISLLADKDINVVQSAVMMLGTIGGPEALQALLDLKARDLTYLQEYYVHEIYEKVEDRYFWNLPPPEERFAEFMRTLDMIIEYLTSSSVSLV